PARSVSARTAGPRPSRGERLSRRGGGRGPRDRGPLARASRGRVLAEDDGAGLGGSRRVARGAPRADAFDPVLPLDAARPLPRAAPRRMEARRALRRNRQRGRRVPDALRGASARGARRPGWSEPRPPPRRNRARRVLRVLFRLPELRLEPDRGLEGP